MRRLRASGAGRRFVLLAVLLAFFVVVPASAASAEPSPTPLPTVTEPQIPSVSPNDMPRRDAGILHPFNYTDKHGAPISSYLVYMDTGDWDEILPEIWYFFIQLIMTLVNLIVGLSCAVIEWALEFKLARAILVPVEDVSRAIKIHVIDALGLPGLFLMLALLYSGWLILFRERSRGFAEIGVSLVVASLATTVLVSPPQMLLGQEKLDGSNLPYQGSTMLLSDEGLMGQARDFSVTTAAIVLADDPDDVQGEIDPDDVAKPITEALVETFVVKPNQLIAFGTLFTGECDFAHRQYSHSAARMLAFINSTDDGIKKMSAINELLKKGEEFEEQCGDQGIQGSKASGEMAIACLFVLIAALIMGILIILVTGTFLTAQAWLAFEAIRGHWALAAGILPGGGRGVLWRWCSAILKAVLGIGLSILFLALLMRIILALMASDTGEGLAVRFIIIDAVAVAALAGHKRIKETAQNIAVNVNRKLAEARVGGAKGSVFHNPSRYGETAPGLKQIRSDAREEAGRVTQPIGKILKGPPRPKGGDAVNSAGSVGIEGAGTSSDAAGAAGSAPADTSGAPAGPSGTAGAAAAGAAGAAKKTAAKKGAVKTVGKVAATVAAAAATGGTSAAAGAAMKTAAKTAVKKKAQNALKNRLAARGGNKKPGTPPGPAARITGAVASNLVKGGSATLAGAKKGGSATLAGAKKGGSAAMARAEQVRSGLGAVKARASVTAGKFTAATVIGAQQALGGTQNRPGPGAPAPSGPRAVATAPQTPGTGAAVPGSRTAGTAPRAGARTAGTIRPPASGPSSVPRTPPSAGGSS